MPVVRREYISQRSRSDTHFETSRETTDSVSRAPSAHKSPSPTVPSNLVWVSSVHAIKLFAVGNYDSDDTGASGVQWVAGLEGICWGLAHIVLEGTAFLLCQHGAGIRSFARAALLGGLWGVVTALVVGSYFSTWDEPIQSVSVTAMFVWEAVLVLLYAVLWAAPRKLIYKRPALLPYAQYCSVSRAILFSAAILRLQAQLQTQ